MAGAVRLRLGSKVVCTDGPAGSLERFIIDLDSGHVTHLDVAHHGHGGGNLVPIGDVTDSGDEIRLSCTSEQFASLGGDTTYRDVEPARSYYDPDALIQLPAFGYGGMGMFGAWRTGSLPTGPLRAVGERLTPQGDTYVERREAAHTSDGHHIGHVDGLIVEPSDGSISHVLLGEGHIFGAKKEVAIPIDAVTEIDQDGAQFSLTKAEIEALPGA